MTWGWSSGSAVAPAARRGAGGDSAHLPHRLHHRGLSQRRIALLLYGLCALFGSFSLWLVRVEKLFAFVGLLLTLVVLVAFVRLRNPGGALGLRHSRESENPPAPPDSGSHCGVAGP